MDDRHLIGFLLFVGLTIYTATNLPIIVEPSTLQRWRSDIMASLPSLQLPEDLSSCVPGTFDGTQCIQVCTHLCSFYLVECCFDVLTGVHRLGIHCCYCIDINLMPKVE